MVTHYRTEDGLIHCEGIHSGDYMLCGIAPEGADGDEQAIITHAPINCKDCIGIIEFGKRIRSGEYVTTQRARR